MSHLEKFGDFQNDKGARIVMDAAAPVQGPALVWSNLRTLTFEQEPPNTPPGRNKCVDITRFYVQGLDTRGGWHDLVEENRPPNDPFRTCDGPNPHDLFVNQGS
ncbi:MAG: hypothetical protein JOZ47_13805 [Kutzneria sp.]|nr:hypothetical protein [Kutzneria sp.]